MERKTYLDRYRLSVDHLGIPVVMRRSEDEATFQAVDEKTGEKVALQVVAVPALSHEVRERLEMEAQAAQKLDHLNVPKLRDFGFEHEQLIYVTEYLEGTTAETWVATQGPMPASVVLRIASQVVSALGAAAFHGIVHHGINPSNVMLVPGQTPDGEWPLIKVLNFVGVAPPLAAANASGATQLNPADFASPEQLESGEVDFRSQMYSLGCTLWFLLKGVPPAGGADAIQHASGVAAPIRHLLESMLAADPDERPLDPLAFHQQIEDGLVQVERRETVASKLGFPIAPSAPVPVRSVVLESKPRGPFSWKPLALAALLFALAIMAALGFARRAHQDQAIGVPIGVPQSAPAPTAIPVEQNKAATQTNEAPVLTSTAGVASDADGAPSETVVANDASRSADASATESQAGEPNVEDAPPLSVPENPQPTAAPLITENNSSPEAAEEAAPLEAPAVSATRPPEPEVAAVNSVPSAERARVPASSEKQPTANLRESREEDVQKDVSIKDVAAAPEKPRVSRAKPIVRRALPVTDPDSAAPPIPRGSTRPRYLGTTPEGNPVFGLPDERIYPAPAVREEKPRRRPRPVVRETTIDNLPVLPALPPDE